MGEIQARSERMAAVAGFFTIMAVVLGLQQAPGSLPRILLLSLPPAFLVMAFTERASIALRGVSAGVLWAASLYLMGLAPKPFGAISQLSFAGGFLLGLGGAAPRLASLHPIPSTVNWLNKSVRWPSTALMLAAAFTGVGFLMLMGTLLAGITLAVDAAFLLSLAPTAAGYGCGRVLRGAAPLASAATAAA